MRQIKQLKQLLLIIAIALASAQQCYAFKKVFRVRPGMEDGAETIAAMAGLPFLIAAVPLPVVWNYDFSTTLALEPYKKICFYAVKHNNILLLKVALGALNAMPFIDRDRARIFVNEADSRGQTLLGYAANKGFVALTTYLTSRSDIDPFNEDNCEYLLHQVLRHAEDNRDYRRIVTAIVDKQLRWVKRKHIDLYKKDADGKIPLEVAMSRKLNTIVIALAPYYSRWDLANGASYLHYAAFYGLITVIDRAMGVLSPQDKNGWTMLHYAAANGKFNTCAYLIFHGADHAIKNNNDKTALELWPQSEKTGYAILQEIIKTRRYAPHCTSFDRYYMGKNLEQTAQKCARGFNKKPDNDIKICFEEV